jgi:glycerol-3-phosphate acyltransferase PlsY
MDGMTLAICAAAYFLGAIPFGFLITKAVTGDDVRQAGSGSTGATNVTRKAGLKAGLATYALDVAKGALAVWLAQRFAGANPQAAGIAGLLAVLGHMFPIFLGFRGGKGVATGVGVFLMLAPAATLAALLVWGIIFGITRTVSLGSMIATLLLPVFVWAFDVYVARAPQPVWLPKVIWALVIGFVIIARHYDNIRNLINRTEYKFK